MEQVTNIPKFTVKIELDDDGYLDKLEKGDDYGDIGSIPIIWLEYAEDKLYNIILEYRSFWDGRQLSVSSNIGRYTNGAELCKYTR
jgi:hypothetical protein